MMSVELEQPYLLLCEKVVDHAELVPLLEAVAKAAGRCS
jgi:hypothetical protein